MAQFTAAQIEARVKALNHQIQKGGDFHENCKQWKSGRAYYVNKLVEMDEYELETIEI
jgi:hypothetical protein